MWSCRARSDQLGNSSPTTKVETLRSSQKTPDPGYLVRMNSGHLEWRKYKVQPLVGHKSARRLHAGVWQRVTNAAVSVSWGVGKPFLLPGSTKAYAWAGVEQKRPEKQWGSGKIAYFGETTFENCSCANKSRTKGISEKKLSVFFLGSGNHAESKNSVERSHNFCELAAAIFAEICKTVRFNPL